MINIITGKVDGNVRKPIIQQRKCPFCKSTRLNLDKSRAELSCKACGHVIFQQGILPVNHTLKLVIYNIKSTPFYDW